MATKRRKKGAPSALTLVLVVCGVLLVVLVVGLLAARSMVEGWLRGDGFREWLAKRAGQVLRAEIDLADLEWKGGEAYARQIAARGRDDAGFSELALDGVRARVGGVADRAVQVPEVSVNRLDLRFSPERPGGPAPSGQVLGASDPTPAEAGPALPEWLARYLPERVEIGQVEVATTRISVAGEGGETFSLNGVRARLEPDLRNGVLAVEGKGGRIAMAGQPEMALKDLALRWKGEDLFVDRCVLGIFKQGHIEARGELGFGGGGRADLEIDVSAIDVDEVAPPEWRERLAGTLAGPIRVSGSFSRPLVEGNLEVSDGVVESLPVLTQIARYTRSERFERLVLNQARTEFRREGERIELRNLVLQSDGLVRVEGTVDIDGDRLAGDLRVGVTPGTMRWIPGAERRVFTEARDGFLWTPMKLGGTREAPTEDLSGRLLAAAGEAIVEDLPSGLIDAAKGLLAPDAGKGKGDELIDQGKKVLEGLAPFLKAP